MDRENLAALQKLCNDRIILLDKLRGLFLQRDVCTVESEDVAAYLQSVLRDTICGELHQFHEEGEIQVANTLSLLFERIIPFLMRLVPCLYFLPDRLWVCGRNHCFCCHKLSFCCFLWLRF